MSFLEKLKLITGGTAAPRRRKTAETSDTLHYLETSPAISLLIFLATVTAIVLISFVGVSTTNLSVLPNQLATVRIVASEPFTFLSHIKTAQYQDQLRNRIPPVYRLEFGAFDKFELSLRDLASKLDAFEKNYPADAAAPFSGPFSPTIQRSKALEAIVDGFNDKGPYKVNTTDVATLLAAGDTKIRLTIVENGLLALREIYQEGVHDSSNTFASAASGDVAIYNIRRPNGEIAQARVQNMEEALTFLRINLAAEGVGRDTAHALFRIFRNGLSTNLKFDPQATELLKKSALANLQSVTVEVSRGQTIIEPGTRVTDEQYEMLVAHRDFLFESGATARADGLLLFGRILLVLAMVMASVFYIRLEDPETLYSNGRISLLALVVILNLALVRAVYSLGDLPFFLHNTEAASILPYLAPTAIAPLILAILIDAGSAIFMALFISLFTSIIYGNRLDLLVITFLASMVGIFGCRSIRRRSRVVRAAGMGGFTVACFALLIGYADRIPLVTIGNQMGAGLAIGLLTGVIVVGMLPVLENLFKRTTDITLLELTDYNHPLLRLMQMETPGTYHHSLVVATLAENAANAIGANPLLSRVCALFHDIGKTIKPQFFTENQREAGNPHDDHNPSFSALIIKSHVKEGVDLAIKHRLPRAVIDVIQQHHGTTLIQYFFKRAKGDHRPNPSSSGTNHPLPVPSSPREHPAPGLDTRVCETTYRYDGPIPQFKESAIIMLADACEASSRSLRKVTPQHLSELIEQVFKDRINDGQLDEAPLTLEEMTKIKSSFTFTLLNMLHSRVAYPSGDEKSQNKDSAQKAE